MAEPNEDDLRVAKHLEAGDIPIRVGNRVKWYTRRQLASQMRDDFEDRHVVTISDDESQAGEKELDTNEKSGSR